MNAIPRVVLASCLLTALAQAQNIPYPSNISTRGSFSNPVAAAADRHIREKVVRSVL